METCVVIINNLYLLNNFECVGPSFIDGDTRFVITDASPVCQQDEAGKMISNYDLLIGTWRDACIDGNMLPIDIALPRYGKFEQSMMLSDIAESLTNDSSIALRYYRPVKCYNKSSASPLRGRAILPGWKDKKLYIRFSHGARGVGNCIFDTSRANLHAFLLVLSKGSQDDLQKFAHAASFNIGMVAHNETIVSELENRKTQDLVVTEVIDNIICESRVCLDYRSKVYFTEIRRVRKNVPKMSIGTDAATAAKFDIPQFYDNGDQPIETIFGSEFYIPNSLEFRASGRTFPADHTLQMRYEIETFLSKLPPMNSVDLFFTEDGKWGIFEFCNQFTTDDMSHSPEYIAEHRKFIANAYSDKLNKGKS